MAKRPAARTTATQPEARKAAGGKRPASRVAAGQPAGTSDLERILERLDALEARIARMEGETGVASAVAAQFDVSLPAPPAGNAAVAPAPEAPEPPAAVAMPEAPQVTEEVMLVLSAAVAAFFGERAHVKQVRLVHSDAWAQQGRVSVMASHRWAIQRG